MNLLIITQRIVATGTIERNVACQPKLWIILPPTANPTTEPAANIELNTPTPIASFSFCNWSLIIPKAIGIIRDQLPKEKLAIGVGVFSSMFAAGSVVGLAVGGSIIQSFGWHATFLSIVPVATILWVIINRFIHDDNNNKRLAEVAEE